MDVLYIFTCFHIGLAILLRMLFTTFSKLPGTQNPLHLWNRQKSFLSFLTLRRQSQGEANSKACIVRARQRSLQKKKSRAEKLGDLKLGKTSMAAVVGITNFYRWNMQHVTFHCNRAGFWMRNVTLYMELWALFTLSFAIQSAMLSRQLDIWVCRYAISC